MVATGFSIVVAATLSNWGIGKDGQLPWSIPAEMAHFKKVTTAVADKKKQNAVIMGRKTYLSIPAKFRPLAGRRNFVLSSTLSSEEGMTVVGNFDDAIASALADASVEKVFVIGGVGVFSSALAHPLCKELIVSRVYGSFDCDCFFPPLPEGKFVLKSEGEIEEDNGVRFQRVSYVPRSSSLLPHDEYQYLNLIRTILDTGVRKGDRTGTGTISIFGAQMRFDLSQSFPLLTTKRVFWRGVAEELLWFVRGDTNGNHLSEKGVKIWDGNGSREFLDNLGLTEREEGDLGPIYGFQWRHFGGEYKTMHDDYTGVGYDQLAEVVDKIKNKPTDRRILLSAWNPPAVGKMALPPCHVLAQFYVADGRLSCSMYQRSCDVGLGVPFNIASYSLLTYMLAHVCGLEPGVFVHNMGDTHVYSNHVEALQEQLKREPSPFPRLRFTRKVESIDDFKMEDFELADYHPQATIKMKMAV
mmetsp:Transcript_47973/g.124571  ORF Transcript_47973/g.124571 Transcript_47973/m.124571 type:complete len:470 (-) Transcript_47973:2073-3482(-)